MNTNAAQSEYGQPPDGAPDFIRNAFGDEDGPIGLPADAVLLSTLLAIESTEPHPGVYAFVQAATAVAFDMGFSLTTTVSFVRHVRQLYVQLLAQPAERQEELSAGFGEEFVGAVIDQLPEGTDAGETLDMAMLRYEHMMRASAFALTAAGERANGGR